MKLRLHHTLQLSFVALALFLGACGKKANKVNSSAYGNGISVNNPIFSSPSGQTIANQYNTIKATTACLNGRTRLINDVSFNVSGNFTGTKIAGNWLPGFMPNGTVSEMFVGVSAYRDLMFLTKVTNGAQVLGYNVTLSYCDVPNGNYPLLISNERALTNFRTLEYRDPYRGIYIPDGIIINTATSCGYGLIASAYTYILSQKVPSNPYTFNFDAYTSFTKPMCNGQF